MGRSARPDFAARLKARTRALRGRLEGRDVLSGAIRDANASLDPVKVATWLATQADEWLPAPCWVVVAHDLNGQLGVVADRGLTPSLGPALWSAANWVMRHGVEFLAGDLSSDSRAASGSTGSAIAFPLICRQKTIGAVVAIDPAPSSAAPSLGPVLGLLLRELFEPAAIALENALTLQRAEALSVTDDLTRLFNSRYLNLVLRRETKRASRSGRPLSLLFIDLDGFKRVNDTHGHLAGSQALVEVAGIVRGGARETDVAARFGGDEFAVVLPDTGREGAVSVAERVRDRVRAFHFLAAEGLAVRLTASIGVATLPDVAASAEELLKAADTAMCKVKAAGKDGIYVMESEGLQ